MACTNKIGVLLTSAFRRTMVKEPFNVFTLLEVVKFYP